MRLYHGSNTRIDSINLAMCRPYKDFAAANDYSLNALVVGLLEEAMAGKIPLPPRK